MDFSHLFARQLQDTVSYQNENTFTFPAVDLVWTDLSMAYTYHPQLSCVKYGFYFSHLFTQQLQDTLSYLNENTFTFSHPSVLCAVPSLYKTHCIEHVMAVLSEIWSLHPSMWSLCISSSPRLSSYLIACHHTILPPWCVFPLSVFYSCLYYHPSY